MAAIGATRWVDLTTTDVETARAFYREVLGWDHQVGEDYTVATRDGLPVGGLMAQPPDLAATGAPSGWTVYFASDDLDADLERAVAEGGDVVEPAFALPAGGRLAVVADPVGAVFALAHFPDLGDLAWDRPGTACWVECHSRDVEAAAGFYERFCGWTPDRNGDYVVLRRDGDIVGGLMGVPDGVPEEAGSYWFLYWRVGSLGDALARVEAAGGRVTVAPMTIDEGTFAVVEDPAGAVSGLFESPVAT